MPVSENGVKKRLLKVLITLVDRPYVFTKKQLAQKYNVHPDTITHDFTALANVGLILNMDQNHRYGLVLSKPLKKLEQLLHFTKEDQLLIYQAIDQVSPHSNSGKLLKQKLASLYDYHKLGFSYLRKPYLSKVDALLQAKEEKKSVVLRDYRSSNSNYTANRTVEPYHPSPPDDILQAYDIEKGGIRHFRISRIKRVEILETPWENEKRHIVMPTDPFRIVDANQIMVHLRLKVGAYNELIERFPLTKAYIEHDEEVDVYDFQCMVNHRFIGLTNFILGYYHKLVEAVSPDRLLDHLRKEVKEMKF